MKKVRRLAAAVLAAGMISISPAAWAMDSTALLAAPGKMGATVQEPAGAVLIESQKRALDKVYQIMPELKDLSVRYAHGAGGAWRVSLTDRSPDSMPSSKKISAFLSFDKKTGDLLSLNIQNPEWATEEIPSPELAREKAAEFVRRLMGDGIKDYQSAEEMGYGGGGTRDSEGNKIVWASANVQFYRLINGIPLLNSGFQVSVDAAGRVTGFHRIDRDDPDPAKFPDLSRAVAREAAEKTFAGMVEMKLNYLAHQPVKQLTLGKNRSETRPVLRYSPSFDGPIDAMTGQLPADFRVHLPQTERITLSGEGKKLIVRTPEEATRLLSEEFGLDMAGLKFRGAETREEMFDPGIGVTEYVWRTEANPGTDGRPVKNMRYAHLTTFSDTGQVVGFNLQDDSRAGRKGTVSREAARKTAIQLLQKYLAVGGAEFEIRDHSTSEPSIPAWVDRSKLDAGYARPPQFNFHFNLTHQGIPVEDRSYSVAVDGLTGKIAGFYDGNGSPAVFLPDSRGIVSADTAKAEFLKNHPLRLTYIWPEYFDQKAPAPYLAYLPASRPGWEYIDAFTGKTVIPEK